MALVAGIDNGLISRLASHTNLALKQQAAPDQPLATPILSSAIGWTLFLSSTDPPRHRGSAPSIGRIRRQARAEVVQPPLHCRNAIEIELPREGPAIVGLGKQDRLGEGPAESVGHPQGSLCRCKRFQLITIDVPERLGDQSLRRPIQGDHILWGQIQAGSVVVDLPGEEIFSVLPGSLADPGR